MTSNPMMVIIDGVRYVPVIESSPGAEAIMRSLALTYTTPERLAEDAKSEYRSLRVFVGYAGEELSEEDPTIEEFVGDLMRSLDQ